MLNCLYCNRDISYKAREAKYCNKKCKEDYRTAKKQEETEKLIKEKNCVQCGAFFLPRQNHPRYKFCSDVCKNKFHNVKAKIEGRDKLWKKLSKDRVRELQRKYYHDLSTGRKLQMFESKAKRRAMQYKSSYCFNPELSSFVFQELHRLRKLRNETTSIEWHVDHIVPIQGINVCGLHVWNNFNLIPKIENLRKGNKVCHL